MPTPTTNFSFNKPLVNNAVDQDLWGGQLNDNWDQADTLFATGIVKVVTSTSNATTIDLSTTERINPVFSHTFTENTTFSFTNPQPSGTNSGFKLFLTNDGTGRTPTWPGTVIWDSGIEPTLTTANEKNILVFETIDGGTIWYGALAIGAAS